MLTECFADLNKQRTRKIDRKVKGQQDKCLDTLAVYTVYIEQFIHNIPILYIHI